jgi:alkanesulfonate monooxygenase SsuD/methylene tetrahydromethanopterin reductase-like flavin-dependent oxidoreductase (luciferase family)
MKVGFLQFSGWRDRSIPLEDIYARALRRIEIMDQAGYDAVWLAEHHFSSDWGRVNWAAGRGFDPVEFANSCLPLN